MSRRCTACGHGDRAAIDAAIVGKIPIRRIAANYGLKESSVRRHRAHISAHLLQAAEAEETLSAGKLLADLRGLQARALTLLDEAEAMHDLRGAVACLRECRGCIETAAKLLETSAVEELTRKLEAIGVKVT